MPKASDPADPVTSAEVNIEPVLKVDEVAQRLRVERNTVYNLVASGALRSVRLGRVIRIPESAVAEFLGGR